MYLFRQGLPGQTGTRIFTLIKGLQLDGGIVFKRSFKEFMFLGLACPKMYQFLSTGGTSPKTMRYTSSNCFATAW